MPQPETCQHPIHPALCTRIKINRTSCFTKQEKTLICSDVALPTAVKIRARAAETPIWYRHSIPHEVPRLFRSQACIGSLGALFSAWSDRGAIDEVPKFKYFCVKRPPPEKTHQVCGTPFMELARGSLLAVPACLSTTSEFYSTQLPPPWKCKCFLLFYCVRGGFNVDA